jgi:hypothetical protein
MSFTSYTFTNLPLVHTLNPDFLGRRLWLCFLLVRESPRSGNLHASWLPNLTSSRLSNFMISQVRGFGSSRIRDFGASHVRDSRLLHVRDFEASQVQDSRSSHIRDFEASQVQDSRSSHIRDFEASQVQDSWVLCSWKLITRISWTSTFRGWHVFLNSPTVEIIKLL